MTQDMFTHNASLSSDRAKRRSLSSTVPAPFLLVLASLAVCTVPACAQPAPDGDTPGVARSGFGDPLATAIYNWKTLQQSDRLSFASYANFLINHPGWPGEADMRKSAERALRPDVESPSQVIAYFKGFPAQSATSQLRLADAYFATGDQKAASEAARQAWLMGALTPEDEARFLTRYAAALQPGDQDTRMDKLLWARSTTAAARQIQLVSEARRPFYAARLAYISKAPDAALKGEAVAASDRNDPAYITDRIYWLRNTGQVPVARAMLASLRPMSGPPADPAKWLDMLDNVMEGAAAEQQWSTLTAIARQVQQTYPAGQSVRDRSLAERNSYTDITWLAGMSALNKLNRPSDAIWFFDMYSKAARSPQTRAKGLYWAGRAAERAGQRDAASSYYAQAAEYFDQFHGQLASEQINKPLSIPQDFAAVEVSGSERAAFDRNEVVRAMQYLGKTGQWQDQTRFVRTIAARLSTPADHALAAELATRTGRTDLALLTGRSAREKGFPGYARYAFPTLRVPDDHASNWTMIHAITRQESQFDREAQSKVGARGLMQLMPGTARQTAPAAGVTYDLLSLTKDPQQNMRLGSTYFGQLMTTFGGSYVLSVAAYNAGPGNVNKWIRANGDPRLPGVDPVNWIEAIPFTETRGYVQRVLENAVVYDQLNPGRGNSGFAKKLTNFLGTTGVSYGSR